MTETKLYVFTDERNDVQGVYEEEELAEFFHYYLTELLGEIEYHYTIEEQLETHIQILGKLARYFKPNEIIVEDGKDLRIFLNLYNQLASNKLFYEAITVKDEIEEQDFIEFVNSNDDGWEQFKNNNYQIPQKKVKVEIHKYDSKNMLRKHISHIVDDNNIASVVRKLIIFEIDDLKENYETDELLNLQSIYLGDLLELDNNLRQTLYPNQTLLDRFCDLFNEEYEYVNDEVKRTTIYS